MSAVNEQIAREYFESHGFFVRQPNKYVVMARNKRPAEEIDLVIVKPANAEQSVPEEMLWTGRELAGIACAVVSVRGWHTERFTAQTLELSPQLFRFASAGAVASVKPLVGDAPVAKIICLPDLPAAAQARRDALEVIRKRGVDGVILFPTMVRELAVSVETSNNYEKSDVLQLLRIIKNYDLFRDEQLELFRERPRRKKSPPASDGN
jgi:hypothetical protein